MFQFRQRCFPRVLQVQARLYQSAKRKPKVAEKKARRKNSSQEKRKKDDPEFTPQRTASAAKPMSGRFNRLVVEKGFAFAVSLYILGESFTFFLTYLIHTHKIPYLGDCGSVLVGSGVVSEESLEKGFKVMDINFSIRLFLNYMLANCLTYPLYNIQYRGVSALVTSLQRVFNGRKSVRRGAVPKAPSPS